jgi:hypothetical protein
MKLLRSIIIGCIAACAAFASTLYISCTKESCSTVCANGGTCNGALCICPTGYEGSNCQITSRNKFLGVWDTHEKGTITSTRINEFGITIDTNNAGSITTIRMINFYDKYSNPILATITGNSLTIPMQIMPNYDTVSGWGTYSSSNSCPTGKIFIYFKIGSSSGVDNFGDSIGAPATLGCWP